IRTSTTFPTRRSYDLDNEGAARVNDILLGLGTNLDERKNNLDKAIELLNNNEAISIDKVSSIYETVPEGYSNQGKFLNMVIKGRTDLKTARLLEVCEAIEEEMGREETILNEPRIIDIDILVYNKENRQLDNLRIPHPRMHERAFVLIPLYEIAPDFVIPTSGKEVADLVEALSNKDKSEVVRWGEVEWSK